MNKLRYLKLSTTMFIFFSLFLSPPLMDIVFAANFPLEITNIRPAGTGNPAIPATNRIFRAYPGIEYNIRAAVIGGLYPYKFSLSNEPVGMTVNANTGEISWPNPQSNTGPITISVTDSENKIVTASWSITVTKNGFLFLNPSYIGTSTGSISQPFKTILQLLQNTTNTNLNDIVYFRGGNYSLSQFGPLAGYVFIGKADESNTPQYRPFSWIGYPGEIVNIDGQDLILRTTNLYLDNLKMTNFTNYGVWIYGGNNYNTIRRTVWSNITSSTATNMNQGFIYISNSGTDYGFVVQENEFYNFTSAQAIGSLYWQTRMLIEDNYFHDGGYPGLTPYCTPIGVKDVGTYYTIRHNRIVMPSSASDFEFYNEFTPGDNAEICFNLIMKQASGNNRALSFFYPKNVHVYRNTIVGDIRFRPTLSSGPYHFTKNILIGQLIDATYVLQSDNITGVRGSNIIDDRGLLTEANKSYIGNYGWEIDGNNTNAVGIDAPRGLTVVQAP